jgi:hypothetical protein
VADVVAGLLGLAIGMRASLRFQQKMSPETPGICHREERSDAATSIL